MNKNTIIVILLVLLGSSGVYIMKLRRDRVEVARIFQEQLKKTAPTSSVRPQFITKGMKFADSPMFSKAYQIAPGDISASAKQALNGWTMTQKKLTAGTIEVSIIPQESQDVAQQFTVKPGFKLFFIELTTADDTTGLDQNRQDDIGVLVDQNGLVQ